MTSHRSRRQPLPPLPALIPDTEAAAPTLTIHNFQPLADTVIRLESPLVVVAEDGVQTSAVLRAVRCLVEPRARPLAGDFRDPERPIEISIEGSAGGSVRWLRADLTPAGITLQRRTPRPAGRVIHVGADRRTGLRFSDLARRLGLGSRPAQQAATSGSAPLELLHLCEFCIACGVRNTWILVEAPELFTGPLAQRALASLLRDVAECGNQVIYTTHSPNLVDGRHVDGVVRLTRGSDANIVATQAPHTPPADVPELVRRLASFDRERNAMFFARRVLLVEGSSERLSLPFAFRLLGHDPDAEGVAIIDAGGKGNLPFLARTLRGLKVPTIVLHDRDAPMDQPARTDDAGLNEAIALAAGRASVVQMAPDFEIVSGLPAHVRHKPSQAWRHYAKLVDPSELAPSITTAIERLMAH